MNDLLSHLPVHIRQQVADYISFLMAKYPIAPSSKAKDTYRERLLNVSVWKEDDIRWIEDAGDWFHQWKPSSW
ncbi:MAG: hypothetical protein R3D00_22575 [Bacteroidia bacterium]